MAIGFGTTDGVGSTDRIDTGFIGQALQRTFALRYRANSRGGGGQSGRLIASGSANAVEFIYLDLVPVANTLAFVRVWSGVRYQWDILGTETLGTTYSVVISYDGSSATNDPVAWVNGSLATITAASSRSGTPSTDVAPYSIGNRGDGLRVTDGRISSVAIWNEIIPENKAQLISGSFSPLIHLPNLVYYNPMIRDSVDIAGGQTQTTTGTAVQPHPPILRERGGGFV